MAVPGEQNIHIGPRKIWLTRHAESVCSDYEPGEEMDELTEEGRRYSMTVAKYLQLEQVRYIPLLCTFFLVCAEFSPRTDHYLLLIV